MIRTALCTAVLSASALFAASAGAAMFGGEGETCSKPAQAVAVNAEGETCSKPAQAVAVNAEGETCSKPAEAVQANAEGEACAAACDKPAEAVAVGNPDAEAMPAALFTPVNENCPGSGMPVTDGVTTVVSGFTVGFCCADCKTAFDAKPEAEQNAYVAKHVKTTINSECPGSGMPVAEGKMALYNGFAVGFCCDDCKATWEQSDDAKKVAYIARQHAPENANCPGSGNPINAEVVALYRGHTVGFCCENCQAKFNDMNDDEKTAIVAGFAMGAEASAACEACEAGECDGDCAADA